MRGLLHWAEYFGVQAEADRVLHRDPHPQTGFVLLPDMKWVRTAWHQPCYGFMISLQNSL